MAPCPQSLEALISALIITERILLLSLLGEGRGVTIGGVSGYCSPNYGNLVLLKARDVAMSCKRRNQFWQPRVLAE